jgi:uncharacterized protein YoxC
LYLRGVCNLYAVRGVRNVVRSVHNFVRSVRNFVRSVRSVSANVSANVSALSAVCPQCVRSVSAFSKKLVEIERYLVSKDMVLTYEILLTHA